MQDLALRYVQGDNGRSEKPKSFKGLGQHATPCGLYGQNIVVHNNGGGSAGSWGDADEGGEEDEEEGGEEGEGQEEGDELWEGGD